MHKLVKLFVVVLILVVAGSAFAESLWTQDSASMFKDPKAAKVGDLITVIIVEGATSSQKASTDYSKEEQHSNDAGVGPLLKLLPEMSFNSSQDGSAKGAKTMSSNLATKLTATVKSVLPNGNLQLEGKRSVVTNGEKLEITMLATARPQDIAQDNSIVSTSLADVQISCSGKGAIADRQKEGIISKIIKWIF